MASDIYIGYMVVGIHIAWGAGYAFYFFNGISPYGRQYIPIEIIIVLIIGVVCGIILFLYGAIKYLSDKETKSKLIAYPDYNYYSEPYPMYHQHHRSREIHKRRSKRL